MLDLLRGFLRGCDYTSALASREDREVVRRGRRRARIAVAVALLAGCATGSEPGPNEATARLVIYPALMELQKHREAQDWTAALETARRIVQNPALQGAPGVRRDALKIALGALEDYVAYYGASPSTDSEAQSYYEEGLRLPDPAEEDRAQLEHMIALYHGSAGRTGRALPHLKRELDHWERSDDRTQLVLAYASLAASYADMGQRALRDLYRERALDLARAHFVLGVRPAEAQSWLAYSELLLARMDDIAGPGRAPEILALWEILEPIYPKYLTFQYKGYEKLSVYLALSGEHEQAAAHYQRALEEWKRVADRHTDLASRVETDLLCTSAHLAILRSEFADGASRIERCISRWREMGMAMDLSGPRLAGRAYEGLGDLARAADAYRSSMAVAEEARASFDVADRIAFFRNGAERSYWGLIRSLAALAERSRREQAFFEVLAATEQLRGRQLGEIIAGAEDTPSADRLRRFRAGLPGDVAVLDYVATDVGLVVLAFSRDDWAARALPADPDLDALLIGVAGDLASPSADPEDLWRRLAMAGERLVGPASRLLSGKQRLVVLPDGAMNAVPFDLLGDPNSDGAPLIRRYAVELAPSLRLALRPPPGGTTTASLFAVGDPTYPESITIAGLTQSEARSIGRRSGITVSFPPLPETRTEVEAISTLFGPEHTRALFGPDASESRIKGADLEPYRFVHFATHGIVGGDVPGLLEPALIFAEEPAEDGFLTASEAEDLELRADLAVLSACNTGSGEYLTGEGVMGMSRAFLVAGSRSVLMSLWSVDSKATELLMVDFYRFLMEGGEPAAALRRAKLSLIEDYERGQGSARGLQTVRDSASPTGRLHPYYWAAFVLLGGETGPERGSGPGASR